ncbi:MAG TPA: response regulator [Gallionella sp.]|nr:response regulator [Gallionella sp.]
MVAAAHKTPKTRKLLLIGDDGQLADWAQRLAADADKHLEFTVLPVGEEVVEWLGKVAARQVPQLILLDFQLPKLDGLAVLRTLRKNVATREIPVIGFSGLYTQEDVQMGYKVGANVCVAKPVSQEELAAMLEQQLAYWLGPRQRELAFATN